MNPHFNYDSVTIVRKFRTDPRLAKESMTQAVALVCLLLLGGLVLAGPSGLLAWSENNHLLAQREADGRAFGKHRLGRWLVATVSVLPHRRA